MRQKYGFLKLIFLLFAALLLPQALYAEEAPVFSLTYSDSSPVVGKQIQVTVKGRQLNDVYGYEINLDYDASRLEYKGNSAVAGFSGLTFQTPKTDTAAGHLQIAHTKISPVSGEHDDVTLVTLTFTAKNAGPAWVKLTDVTLVDSQATPNASRLSPNVEAALAVASSGGRDHDGKDSGSTGSGGSTSTSGSLPATGVESRQVVSQDQISKAGSTVIELKEAVSEVRFPSNIADLLAGHGVELRTERYRLSLPTAVFKQLGGRLTGEELKDSYITLIVRPLPQAEAAKLLGLVAVEDGAVRVRAAGDIYELSLSITAKNGKTAALTALDEPIVLRLKADVSVDPKLCGIYAIADNGELAFMGGRHADDGMSVSVGHLGKLAMLELTAAFADLPQDHWVAAVIRELAARHIVNGTGNGAFEPSRSVTRAEFTSLLVRALHLKELETASFTDVRANDWFAEDVNAAVKAGIIQGKEERLFAPNAPITREEMAAMLIRAAVHAGASVSGGSYAPFGDEADVSQWALEDVKKAASMRLMQGRDEGQFAPQGITTRAESAQVIYNLLQLAGSGQGQ